MDKNIIYSINNSAEDFDIPRAEILRYMASGGDESSMMLIDGLLPESIGAMSPKASFVRLGFKANGSEFELGNIKFCSKSLAEHLHDCNELIILSLSLGHAFDRLMAKYSALCPSKAFCINAVGASAIESYADMVCRNLSDELLKENMHLSSRFSPGYGDLPLSLQESLLSLSDAGRRIGISLNKSLIMSPSKSVTAIIGISKCSNDKKLKSCETCSKLNCIYRKQAKVQ